MTIINDKTGKETKFDYITEALEYADALAEEIGADYVIVYDGHTGMELSDYYSFNY